VYIVTSLSLICAVVLSKAIGCSLPIIAKVFKLDPALMAGPLITTIVDALVLIIYFVLAKVFLM
ncbi:MAG: magnesium transporter, partial [Acutalibacteraceae bacterium]